MSLKPDDQRVTDYAFDELDAQEVRQFEEEMNRSPELKQAVEETRRLADLLRDGLAAETNAGLTDEQRKAVYATLPSKKPVDREPSLVGSPKAIRNFLVRLAVPFTIAASVLVALWCVNSSLVVRQTAKLAQNDRNASIPKEAQIVASKRDKRPHSKDSSTVSAEKLAVDYLQTKSFEAPSSGSSTAIAPTTSTKPAAKVHPVPSDGAVAMVPSVNEHFVPSPSTSNSTSNFGITFSADGRNLAESADAKNRQWGAKQHAFRREHLASPQSSVRANIEDVKLWKLAKSSAEITPTRGDHGMGPGQGGDKYSPIIENVFRRVSEEPRSTFSIDVDTASYSKVRMSLMQHGMLPRPDAVRIEELINYFEYDYSPPSSENPFAAHLEVASCPWNSKHRLVRIGLQGRIVEQTKRPSSNLVFLLDVSGSMNQPNKLPLLKQAMKLLTGQLNENDRVSIVVYAGAAGCVLEPTSGNQKQTIIDALDQLHAGGSTNGGQGIQLAYQMALDHFIQGGTNRVVLCTDGDFNVGVTGTDELVRIVETQAKAGVFVSVFGFGMGNHNDAMLETISNRGNGNYGFIDTEDEARKVFVEQLSGTLVTIAKDVKLQVEFNPHEVQAYRLIGYENRILATEDFNDDKKDAGEIGAGHSVTALYELIPAGSDSTIDRPTVDELRYQSALTPSETATSGELLTLSVRHKKPDEDTSTKLEFPVRDGGQAFSDATADFQFAAAVAQFGMLLRDSQFKGDSTFDAVLEIASDAISKRTDGYRDEFLRLVKQAKSLAGS